MRDKRKFVCYWWHTGMDHISIGVHICVGCPNIEIHLPFGFFKIGFDVEPACFTCAHESACSPWNWRGLDRERAEACRGLPKRRLWSGPGHARHWTARERGENHA